MSIEASITRLEGFKSLAKGWDGGNAPKPSDATIDRAIAYLKAHNVKDGWDANPHRDGSVLLSLKQGSLRKMIRCDKQECQVFVL